MSDEAASVTETSPTEAWEQLKVDAGCALIDVRTRPEWMFVGTPDLSSAAKPVHLIAWRQYPDMQPDPQFAEKVATAVAEDGPTTLFFICRSGARSMEAAHAVAQSAAAYGLGPVTCVNVAEGFEGDKDQAGQRGRMNGWKARGLPWQQS